MVLDEQKLETLIKRLDEQRQAYLESQDLLHQLLEEAREPLQSPLPVAPQSPQTSQASSIRGMMGEDSDEEEMGEDSDEEETGEEFFARTPLKHQAYTEEGLQEHLASYKWPEEGQRILADVLDAPKRLLPINLFPKIKGPVPDRSHLSHHQVFEIGTDGVPLALERPEQEQIPSNALKIWHAIKEVNKPSNQRRAVGRITVMHEISPILFGAIHFTMHKVFDVDELFKHLVQSEGSTTSLNRVYDNDERRRRSFVFNFEYFTLMGEDCKPMEWQLADRQQERAAHHIAITRCSSVVALHLGGKPIKRIKNRSRRGNGNTGEVFDPFAAWQVLNIQCYPDWQCSLDVHDSTRRYVNGVEAFMVTILGEFRDAQKRFEGIYHKITRLITPPIDLLFNEEVRERLLFDDAEFTFVRRYFWAVQALEVVQESLKVMIDAYEDNFTEEVWLGTHGPWRIDEPDTARNLHYRKKMLVLRGEFEVQMQALKGLSSAMVARRDDINRRNKELIAGTSIQESRRSAKNSDISVLQGRNIKLLTLASIFFLPLSFVTSVFGMTSMPTDQNYWFFGKVMACVCVPFYVFIGLLSVDTLFSCIRAWIVVVLQAIANFLAWLSGRGVAQRKVVPDALYESRSRIAPRRPDARWKASIEARRGMRMRMRVSTAPTASEVPRSDVVSSGVPVNSPGIPARQVGGSAAAVPPMQLASMMLQESRRTQRINYNLENTHNIV